MGKIVLHTLGCKLNQAETESLASQLLSSGHQLVESPEEADVYVLNTCSVTHIADRKSRQLLRAARRSSPDAMIVAVGCYAQRAPQDLRQLGVVDITLEYKGRDRLFDVLQEKLGDKGGVNTTPPVRTRSLIKIQEGCDDFCSFCIVPYTRGRERCLPLEEVLREVKARLAAGYKEITLTGTKIGAYNKYKNHSSGLSSVVAAVLEEQRLSRLRLSSLQPKDLNIELLKLWDDERLCPHLHIPLQSGSQKILQSMGRGYSIYDYERAITMVRESIPDLAVTTDIIVGFPGEGEKEFEESYRFCEKMGFANMHVFPFSARSGTKASGMSPKVENTIIKDRSRKMMELAQRCSGDFNRHFLGRTMGVLWEKRSEKVGWSGMTDNYIRVFTKSEEDLTNTLLPTKLLAEHPRGLLGELVNGGRQ